MSKREKTAIYPFFSGSCTYQLHKLIQDQNGIYFRVLFDLFSGSYSLIKP
jgi:hypothetical protein